MVSDSSEHPIRAVMVAMMMIMMMEREAHAPAHEGTAMVTGTAEHEGKNEKGSEQPEHCGFLLSGGQRVQNTHPDGRCKSCLLVSSGRSRVG